MPRRALRLALLLAVPLQACTYWGEHPLLQPARHEFIVGTVRVTRRDSAVFFLDNVSVRTDSITGAVHGLAGRRMAFSTDEVRSLETRRENSFGTVIIALGTGAAALLLWAYVAIATEGAGS